MNNLKNTTMRILRTRRDCNSFLGISLHNPTTKKKKKKPFHALIKCLEATIKRQKTCSWCVIPGS
jgi:hypothetical protein